MEVLVSIHAQSDSCGNCRDASHVFPPLGRRANLALIAFSPEPRGGGHHCVREAIEDGEKVDEWVAELSGAVERFLRV
jgi:hypothetical protein